MYDVNQIVKLNPAASHQASRAVLIRESVEGGRAFVAESQAEGVVGYAVLENLFFDQGFLRLLYVQESFRRQNVASALIAYAERITSTAKLFTSAAESNAPMRRLLEKLGYQRSGIVEDLGDNEPELIYCKRLR